MKYRVCVPASSANLGPGFDALGLALDLHLVCTVESCDCLTITASGVDPAEIPEDESNLIWQTALQVAADENAGLPPIKLDIANSIPIGKGLGSSAAALTAGVVIASQFLELNWSRHQVLNEAAKIEGHPDNVSACVLGAVVASSMEPDGQTHAVRIELPANYGVAAVVPEFVLSTTKARSVLPDTYSRSDAVFNVQHSALLIAALCTGSTESFSAALQDKIHQPYRAPLIPGFAEMLDLHKPGLLGCALSGSGPSVLVFYERGSESVTQCFEQLFAKHGTPAKTYFTEIQRNGYTLEKLA
ncbi:MAG: homoserine kinase [Acidobacteriaceae bacterium]|nr:homoserine kinase [Acidobacteriaceae bacterium]